MTKTVLLVDYENVQKVDFVRLARETSVLFVFGAKNTRVPAELLLRQQELRERFRIIAISEVQTNAADFCIAYYLGEQLTREPHTRCVILSKDKKAFDPLIRHLVSERKLSVSRVNSFDEAFPKRPAPAKASSVSRDAYRRVLELLAGDIQRPKTRAALERRLKSWLPSADEAARAAVLARLFSEAKVAEDGKRLVYSL